MNSLNDDAVDAMVRKQFDGPVPDDGFCDRVLQQLPLRRRPITWPLAAGVLLGTGACWCSLFAEPLLHAGWRSWLHGELSGPTVTLLAAMAGMSLLALGWAVAEADDR